MPSIALVTVYSVKKSCSNCVWELRRTEPIFLLYIVKSIESQVFSSFLKGVPLWIRGKSHSSSVSLHISITLLHYHPPVLQR
jgi:hypothetical protein